MLSYGRREEFARGLDGLLLPGLTMAQEFDRADEWFDWKGNAHTLRGAWAYVTGPAVAKPDCTAGFRDEHHDGWTVEDFLEVVNAHIKARREEIHAERATAAPADDERHQRRADAAVHLRRVDLLREGVVEREARVRQVLGDAVDAVAAVVDDDRGVDARHRVVVVRGDLAAADGPLADADADLAACFVTDRSSVRTRNSPKFRRDLQGHACSPK